MKKILKHILLCGLFFCSFSGSAQSKLKNYLDSERKRIQKVQNVETEIEKFISKNIDSYVLPKSVVDKLAQMEEKLEPKLFLEQLKRKNLRKQYLSNHLNLAALYTAGSVPVALRQTCVDGDFGDTLASNFTFWSDNIAGNQECNVGSAEDAANVVTPAVNDSTFTSLVTIFDTTRTDWDSTTMYYDGHLSSLTTPVLVPTISPNGGHSSIKLNNNGSGSDVTTMSRRMLITDPTLEYEFSLMLQASGHLMDRREPIFTVRIYDLNRNLIQRRCIISQPDCIFNVAESEGGGRAGNSNDVYYTGWMCDAIDVSALVGLPPDANGVNAIVEFTIADCGYGGHYGTVYIDNICGFTCEAPAFGIVRIDPPATNCPEGGSYQICGSYSMPANSVLDGVSLQYSTNGGATFIRLTTGVTLTTTVIDARNGTFCFTIDSSFFNNSLVDRYIFQVLEAFTQTCDAGTFINENTTLAVVDFSECCLNDLTLTSPTGDMDNGFLDTISHKERHEWIRASNLVNVGNTTFQDGVVYHAGRFIELRTGFQAFYGSHFAGYIQDCVQPDSYIYKGTEGSHSNDTIDTEFKLLSRFVISPNPATNSIDLTIQNDTFNKIIIAGIDGKIVLDKTIEPTGSYNLDISRYASGVYIVNVVSNDGKQYSQKLIKN
jgi:hypothetical protein